MIQPSTTSQQTIDPRRSAPAKGWEIAIIGAACRLPSIENLESLWKQLRAGRSTLQGGSVSPPSLRHLTQEGRKSANGSGHRLDLETLWFLDAAQDALHDAGLGNAIGDFGRVEVIMARGERPPLVRHDPRLIADLMRSIHPDLDEELLNAARSELEASLAAVNAAPAPRMTEARYIDTLRISEPTFIVEAGAGGGLLAVELACRSLLDHRAQLAIAGAVDLGGAADSGQGRGVGIVVLKRLADAEQNGDRVDSVIQGIGACSRQARVHDSNANVLKDYRQTLRRAYRLSGIDPSTVDLIVSGTGDPERQACEAIFKGAVTRLRSWRERDREHTEEAGVGGMLDLIQASLAIRQRSLPPSRDESDPRRVHRETIESDSSPQTARPWIRTRLDQPRRAGINVFSQSGLSLHAVIEEPHRAFAKANTGLISDWDSEAIFLDAHDRASWLDLARALIDWLEGPGHLDVPIKDLAHTLNVSKEKLPFRVGMVVTSARDLRDRLGFLITKLGDPNCQSIRDGRGTYFREEALARDARVAFLFPGEGSQYPGMLADLAPYFPEILHGFETSDRIARDRGHAQRPSDAIFQADTDVDSGLFSTVAAVNIVLSAQLGLYRLISRLGIKPDAVAGHSSGEFLAMVAAGIFPADSELEDRLGRLGSIFETLDSQGAVPKAKLLAASAPRERLESLMDDLGLSQTIAIAIDNCPHQVILAGGDEDMESLIAALRGSKILFEVLPFDRAYHTSRFQTAIEPIRSFFRELPMRRPSVPIYSCMTAATMPNDLGAIRTLAVEQWQSPVAFRSTIDSMYENGVRVFIEVGVRGSLTGFVDDILRSRPHLAIASNLPRRSGMTQLNHLVANLHAEGLDPRVDDFYRMRNPRVIDFSKDLPTTASPQPIVFETPSTKFSDALIQRIRSSVAPPEVDDSLSFEIVPNFARMEPAKPTAKPIVKFDEPNDIAWRDDAERMLEEQSEEALRVLDQLGEAEVGASHPQAAVFVAYLKTMDEFLETQRSVLEAYLGVTSTIVEDETVADAPTQRRRRGADIIHDLPQSPIKLWEAEPDQSTAAEPMTEAAVSTETGGIEEILLDEVSRRTGYPREILGLDLDMESDLGIDSIKRVEILGELRSRAGLADDISFDRLARCQTLGAIVAELAPTSTSTARKPAEIRPNWPGGIVEWTRGERFVGSRVLDGSSDPMASEHTLGGRRISAADPGLLGLPVVPFTVMVEYLAQAASMVEPGKVVVGFRDVQAHRWIPYESEPSTLEFQAIRREKDGAIGVRIWDRGIASRNGSTRVPKNDRPSVEGFVLLADRRPESPEPWPYDPGDAGPCRFKAQELYDDQWLFHGPPLQALKRVGLASPTAIEGSLVVLPRRALLPEREWPTLHTDPIVFDAFTHLLGCWGLDKQAGEEGDLMFPLRMAKLDLFGAEPPEGSEILCRIQVQEVTRHQVRVNAELVGPNNATWTRVEGWEDWRFYWADRFRDVCRNPQGILIGKPLAMDSRPETLSLVAVEPPSDMLKPIWGDVIEWIHLSPEERQAAAREWPHLRERNRRLLGKIAAKEGARRLWLSAGFDAVYPADLEVAVDPLGESRIQSRLANDEKPMPKVAYTSIDGIGLAAASLDPEARLGVAIETIGDQDHRVTTGETDWVDREIPAEADRLEWVARIQAAKAAVARIEPARSGYATPINEPVRVDLSSGAIDIGVAALSASGRRQAFHVLTGLLGEHVWALTLGERIELP